MLITRSQGAACRRAAERIAGLDLHATYRVCNSVDKALKTIGWESMFPISFKGYLPGHRDNVLTALLWCAEIAGEA